MTESERWQLSETCWSDGGRVQFINNQPNPRGLQVIKGKTATLQMWNWQWSLVNVYSQEVDNISWMYCINFIKFVCGMKEWGVSLLNQNAQFRPSFSMLVGARVGLFAPKTLNSFVQITLVQSGVATFRPSAAVLNSIKLFKDWSWPGFPALPGRKLFRQGGRDPRWKGRLPGMIENGEFSAWSERKNSFFFGPWGFGHRCCGVTGTKKWSYTILLFPSLCSCCLLDPTSETHNVDQLLKCVEEMEPRTSSNFLIRGPGSSCLGPVVMPVFTPTQVSFNKYLKSMIYPWCCLLIL